ncbi:MAG: anhydro-N-acetylmuramic acid kinase [Cohaesibacteraceae bacterium]
MRAIGTMSGTSMDGVDVALIETDGMALVDRGPAASLSLAYSPNERKVLFDAVAIALDINSPECLSHPTVLEATQISTQRHAEALVRLLDRLDSPAEMVGYHGQTILHRPDPKNPSEAFTLQVGDPQVLADATGLPTVYDFRGADVGAGGQGAPLAPLYHQALLTGRTELPALIVNLGGIANITVVRDDDPTHLMAADIGPANVYLDDEMMRRKHVPFDEGGRLAAAGSPDEAVIDTFFDQPFYQSASAGPASLDRYGLVAPDVAHLSNEDAMATLSELTVRSVERAVGTLDDQPRSVFVAGGGARNPHLMSRLSAVLPCPVEALDALGASAAMLEAEAFAYLAVRHIKKLPLTYPNTTGAPRPLQGGRLVRPKGY